MYTAYLVMLGLGHANQITPELKERQNRMVTGLLNASSQWGVIISEVSNLIFFTCQILRYIYVICNTKLQKCRNSIAKRIIYISKISSSKPNLTTNSLFIYVFCNSFEHEIVLPVLQIKIKQFHIHILDFTDVNQHRINGQILA